MMPWIVSSGVLWSPSSRRAWIEMRMRVSGASASLVALLAEGVDRNMCSMKEQAEGAQVALLAEGVDRNLTF